LFNVQVEVPFILVGTKVDLRNDLKEIEKLRSQGLSMVTTKQGNELAKNLKALKYLECSPKTQVGVREVFEEVVSTVLFPKKKKGFFGDVFGAEEEIPKLMLSEPSGFRHVSVTELSLDTALDLTNMSPALKEYFKVARLKHIQLKNKQAGVNNIKPGPSTPPPLLFRIHWKFFWRSII
jgi:hypothetical protein